jgi:hypothetical protein
MRIGVRRRIVCLVLAFVSTQLAFAQEIAIDWPGRTVTLQPSEIHKGDTVKVTVSDINNIVYDYKVNVSLQIQGGGDDLAQLGKLIGLSSAGPAVRAVSPANCVDALSNANDTLGKLNIELHKPENNLDPSTSPKSSIPLKKSLNGWAAATTAGGGLLSTLEKDVSVVNSKCTRDESKAFFTGPYDTFDKLRKKVEAPHTADAQSVASTGDVSAVIIRVVESYTDDAGKAHTVSSFERTLTFSPVLSLSGGVLFSTLRHPSYIRQTVPGSTDPVLAIDTGADPVPSIVGLLNYRIPKCEWGFFGLALSSGPVLRVGGTSGTSSFGYFNGISGHLWHRLFVTAGSHVGQFPDIPLGFRVGQAIPSSFGQLTPTSRWSARFAVAVTYKTNDLGALSSQSGTAKTDTGTGKPKSDSTGSRKDNSKDRPKGNGAQPPR